MHARTCADGVGARERGTREHGCVDVWTVWGAREMVEMGVEKEGWPRASMDWPACAEGVEVLH